jgi:hypothetical protein
MAMIRDLFGLEVDNDAPAVEPAQEPLAEVRELHRRRR